MPRYESDDQLEWELTCSPSITSDPLWKLDVYRASMYLLHVSPGRLRSDRTRETASLYG